MTEADAMTEADYLDSLTEYIDPIWKNALAARNKADECLHAIRELRMQLSTKQVELAKEALKKETTANA